MNKQLKYTVAVIILLVVLLVVSGSAFLLGDKHALETMKFKSAAPDQIANAMKEDHFYNDYRASTLIVRGQVALLSRQDGDTVIGLKANSSYKALCDLGNVSSVPRVGTTITVMAEGATAQRQPAAVLLKNCIIR